MRLLLALLLLSTPLHAISTNAFFGIGYRNDRQSFDFSTPTCDPISKLDWKSLQSVQFFLIPQWRCGRVRVVGEMAIGILYSGCFFDKDWDCTGQLISDAHSRVTGYNYDFDLGVGADLFCNLRPMIGAAYHQQFYKNWDLCKLVVPIEGGGSYRLATPWLMHEGLFSTFRSEWLTGWLGLAFDSHLFDCWQLLLSVRGHVGGNRSWGDWRLRGDLMPRKGWSNVSTAFGTEAQAALAAWVCGGGAFTLLLRYRYFWTTQGNHYTYAANGACATARLNRAHWDSATAALGFIFCY